jgi:hypothetical protein
MFHIEWHLDRASRALPSLQTVINGEREPAICTCMSVTMTLSGSVDSERAHVTRFAASHEVVTLCVRWV